MSIIKLQQLLKRYQNAFRKYDLDAVSRCYHLPCTLNTPDKVVLLKNKVDCEQEFIGIFEQLKAANMVDIIAKKSTAMQVSQQVYLVCIDWDFVDVNDDVFADFSAIYHVLDTDGELTIININSHELENSLALPESFSW